MGMEMEMADHIVLFAIAVIFAFCMFFLNTHTRSIPSRLTTYLLMWGSFLLAMYAMFQVAKEAIGG